MCSYIPANLLTVIANRVPEDPNLDRYISVDSALCFEVWVVNDPIYNYVSNNTISGSVVLDRLAYTNLQCADDTRVAGVVGSRRSVCGWHGITTASQNELDNLLTGSQQVFNSFFCQPAGPLIHLHPLVAVALVLDESYQVFSADDQRCCVDTRVEADLLGLQQVAV